MMAPKCNSVMNRCLGFNLIKKEEEVKQKKNDNNFSMFLEDNESSGYHHSTSNSKPKKKKNIFVPRKEFLKFKSSIDQILVAVTSTQPLQINETYNAYEAGYSKDIQVVTKKIINYIKNPSLMTNNDLSSWMVNRFHRTF